MADTARAGYGNGPGTSSGDGPQDKAKQAVGDAKEQVKDQAQQAAGQARGRVRDEADRRSTQAGERISEQASDIRSVGEQLREKGKDGPAKIVDQVAERAERAGGYLQRTDGDTLLNDIEDLARQKPWAVVAGGLALGFAASRVLKTSSRDRFEQRSGGSNGQRALPPRTSPATTGVGYGTGTGAVDTPAGLPGTAATTPLPGTSATPASTPATGDPSRVTRGL